MFKNFNSLVRLYIIVLFCIIILVSIFFIPFFDNSKIIISNNSNTTYNSKLLISSKGICWPLPGYTTISSPFGYRSAPTAGASSFHGGVDLPAPARNKYRLGNIRKGYKH